MVVIVVKSCLEFPVSPDSLYHLVVYLQLAWAVLDSLRPLPPEYFAVGEEEGASSLFHPIHVLSFVPVSVRPGENAIAGEKPIGPSALVDSVISVGEGALAMKIAPLKVPLVDSRLTDIVPVALFDSLFEISLVV